MASSRLDVASAADRMQYKQRRAGAMQWLRLTVAPVFFILALINVDLPSHAMHMMDGAAPAVLGVTVPAGLAQVLSSMWLMYALMGVAHLTPWLSLFRPRSNGDSEF